jgi:hypothetical protein
MADGKLGFPVEKYLSALMARNDKHIARTLLLTVIFCCGTAFAQQNEPLRAPFFQGEVLPTPPQQNAPWPHGDDLLSKAAATLFEQGLADPRGLEYREIEIAVGNPWDGGGYAFKTHGWIFPDNGKPDRFAIAWNGLVYPVVRIGNAADLHKDWPPDAKIPKDPSWAFEEASESRSVSPTPPTALKIVLLLRLGEVDIDNRISKFIKPEEGPDPYLSLANDWAWFAFDRAICAHERGDDRLALADARRLSKIQPLVESEAKRRTFPPPRDFPDSRFPDRSHFYLSFLKQLPDLLADCERRLAEQKKSSLRQDEIASLIVDLQNVDARQWAQPGGVTLAEDPRVQALVMRGNEVVEPLLDAMENDTRLTRSVSFRGDFFRSRYLISVSETAYAALVDLLRVDFHTDGVDSGPVSNKELVAKIRSYWAKMGSLPPAERFYIALKG